MATLLYRLGRGAFRRRRWVTLSWAAVLLGVVLAAMSAGEAADDSDSMPGIESQQAFDLINERFPDAEAEGASARIVLVAPDGRKVTAAEYRAAIGTLVAEVADGPQVAAVSDPLDASTVSEDGTTAYATVTYEVTDDNVTDAGRKDLGEAVEKARASGLTVEAGGGAVAGEPPAGIGEFLGIAVAAVVLLITFGSLAAAGLPLITAVVGVALTLASIIALGSALGMSTATADLAMMIGIAVGVDYALLVVSRYREERAKGNEPREAAGLAVGTAGSAVVFAGLTVVIALAGLSVIGVPSLTKMGLAAAGAVVLAVLITLTLVPALCGFWPDALLARRVRKGPSARPARRFRKGPGAGAVREAGAWSARWARFVRRRPVPVLLGSVILLGALAVPALDLRLGMPGDEAKPTSTTERRAYDALADGFGPGFNGPLTLVVDARRADDPRSAVAAVSERVAGTDGVVSVSPPRFNAAGDTAVIQAVPSTAPTSERTEELVRTIRAERAAAESATGATFEVTGTTALNIDVARKMTDALIPYLLVVVGLAFLLLLLVFRSVLVPLKAALGFLLSVGASFGVLVTIFQNGHGSGLLGVDETGPIMSTMPLMLVGIVFGLAMDYQVFLVSRMREAVIHGERPAEAVVTGFRHSGRVVTAAAVIMTSVFGGFMTGGETLLKMVGFGLAVAVLFDAFVVRMAFVPAVLVLLGKRAWWLPRRLDRLLPRVDVEGEALGRRAAAAPGLAAVPGTDRQDTVRA
ncbi:MMPL family transporter [Streptomyces sp. MH60]|uniref:MMPL family transporter n=1 Tax=Streptomyces sp. MH60 TaxID=1940758 RepID=UPI000CEE46BF|nr:MMPL family transporter [Streptomyces sp. MH60]PPS91273.1 Membrane protein YdfJ [Streptomyces sp. MH60]